MLYVCQREVGHTTTHQNDIILSDDLTTCHIVALYSYSDSSNGNSSSPLSSLSHVDKPQYESCIRKMIQTHKEYHGINNMIYMDIHILGGFNDDDGSSREITQYLLSLLTTIANEEKKYTQMFLKTCLVSSLNHSTNKNIKDPIIGRGLAMNTKTGCTYLVKSIHPSNLIGPEIVLRSCRIYARHKDKLSHDTLSLIHTYHNNKSIIYINPIKFRHDDYYNFLLSVEDDNVILNLCSTSPMYERDDFCDNLRSTLMYIRDHNSYEIFGKNCDCILKFVRVWNDDSNSYAWI